MIYKICFQTTIKSAANKSNTMSSSHLLPPLVDNLCPISHWVRKTIKRVLMPIKGQHIHQIYMYLFRWGMSTLPWSYINTASIPVSDTESGPLVISRTLSSWWMTAFTRALLLVKIGALLP